MMRMATKLSLQEQAKKVLEQAQERGLKTCAECEEYPCPKTRECFAITKSFEPMCRQVCTEAEYQQLKKAFFEKEENLNTIRNIYRGSREE